MSSFHTRLSATGHTVGLRLNGEQAVYTPASGTARTISILVVERKTVEEMERNQARNQLHLITFSTTDSTTGIDNPRHNDKLSYDGKIWRHHATRSHSQVDVTVEWVATQDIHTRGA